MRLLAIRLLACSLLLLPSSLFAHNVTISGTQTFASLDGSSSDHDGAVNGVFTVNDGDLAITGVVNCNDDTTTSACSMAFAVSGNLTIGTGGALYAENRSGGGTGGAITLTVGGDLAMNGNAIVSTASKSSSGSTGGNITATVSGDVALGAGTTIDSGSANAQGGAINIAASGLVSVDGNVLSGPSRTLLATRLGGGAALDGGSSNVIGGAISIGSTSFAEPALTVGATANVISQGADSGAGPITLDGCGIQVRGLVAALSRKAGVAQVNIRSGKDVLIDGRDLGATGTRMGRVRADAPTGTALNKGIDIFAAETIDIFGPGGSSYVLTSLPGLHDTKSYGGLIRITSLGDVVNASGNVIDDGHSASGDTGGTVEIAAKEDVNLNTAVIRAHGDFNTGNNNRGGGIIRVRSYSGDVIWTNGVGEVRPVGSTSGLALADQGSITLTACGTVDITGSTFPVMGVATSPLPQTQTGVCSPAAPSLPTGVPALITCNTPPVANDGAASTNEDTTVTITLSGSDADGDPLTFSIVSGPSNGSLGPVISTGPTTATVDYSPNLNYFGGDSFVFQANDGQGGTDNATVTITVAPVNDPPTFLAGPTVTVLEDSGAQTITGWVSGITAGPANETGQTVTFTVTNDNPSLFSVQPSVAPDGTLTFTPATNEFGSATITIVAQDDGGTANGGDDTSDPQTSSITVTGVNDEPSFTAGGDVSVLEDSGAYSAGWATSISAGPNEGSQTLTFTVTNDNNGLFSTQPSINSSGVLTFVPAADAFGSAEVTVTLSDDGGTANGGDDTSDSVTFTITVDGVNDAPSFTSGGDVTVNEDSGAYSAAWATDISAGPANESTQTVTFNIISNSNSSLFASAPSISSTGVLSFTLAANASGSATLVVNAQDDGGIANGGDDTSSNVTFTIIVNDVNDAPSFTPGGDVTVAEDSGAYSAAWASSISAGPGESGQTLTFNVSNDANGLFAVQPAISASGVLTFTPAPNQFGTATVTVSLSDDGGTANGGDDTSDPVTFTITITGVNDPPSAGNDAWQTFGNTEIRVDLGAAITTPAVYDTTTSGTGVLDNDADSIEGDPFSITSIVGCADTTAPFDCTFGDGSKLSMNANGSFTFTPGAGTTSASFQYVVTDQPAAGVPASATGTVTFTLFEMIWYVNPNVAPGGTGVSNAPFNSFASLNSAGDVDDASDYIFVHKGTLNDHIVLESGQKLWGEGIGLILPHNLNGNGGPTTLLIPGGKPNVIAAAANTVTVSSVNGTEVAGLNLSSLAGSAIYVESNPAQPAAGVIIYSNAISAAAAHGVSISSDTMPASVIVNDTTINVTGNGIYADAVSGTLSLGMTNLAIEAGGSGVWGQAAAGATLNIAALSNIAVSGNTSGDGIRLAGATFDSDTSSSTFQTVNASASVGAAGNPVGGAGVVITNASGDLAFASLPVFASTTGVTLNGSALYTPNTAGFRVTSVGGSISTPAGVGLTVTTATIGAANLSFTSINAAGAANGIVLNNTGTSGGLKVLGTGAAGSGGTIQSMSGDGISLTSTEAVSLSWMNVTGNLGSGIRGTTVNGFVLNNASITGNGDSPATDESGINITDLTGTAIGGARPTAINNSTISNNHEFEVQVTNSAGTLTDFQINNGTVSSNGASGVHGNLVNFIALGTANMTLNVTGGTYTGNAPTTATAIHADASGGSVTANVSGATFLNNNVGVNVSAALSGNLTFDVHDNPLINGTRTHALNFFLASNSTGTVSGKFRNNVIGTLGAAGSGSTLGFGVRVQNEAINNANLLIDGNTIQELAGFAGINVNHGIAGSPLTGATNVTITNNTIRNVNARAIVVQQNLGKGTVCADIAGNVMSGIAGAAGDGTRIRIRQLAGGVFNVKQKVATAAVDPLELDDANGSTVAQISAAGTFNYNSGGCPQP